MKRKKMLVLKTPKLCIAVLCTKQENSCTIQDYVYSIQVTCLNPVSKKCNKKIIWAKRGKTKDKMATISCTVSASGLASGISQSESVLR